MDVRDKRVANVLRRLQDLPGRELFRYFDDEGTLRSISSDDVNDYIREAGGGDFTAKDFRTWAGTALASWALQELGARTSHSEARRHAVAAVEAVAKRLGNTPTVCRSAMSTLRFSPATSTAPSSRTLSAEPRKRSV